MASSSNRFAVLGGTPSSSKGQKEKVPVTGTGDKEDQPMQDTAQASPSLSLSGLDDSLPKMQSKQEIMALFRKRRQEFFEREEANAREKERMKKSQGRRKPTTLVGSLTPSAGLLSQGPRKRTASSDEAEKPSKRQHMGSRSPSQTVGEPAVATSMTVSAIKTQESDVVREKASAATDLIQADPVLSPWWADIRIPEKALPCIIQVNCLDRWGTFDETAREWTFLLAFEVGHQRGPAMIMKFFSSGVTGLQNAQTGWRLSDYIEDEWMVLDFSTHRVSGSSDRRICHRRILEACQTDEEKARCMCIRLEACQSS